MVGEAGPVVVTVLTALTRFQFPSVVTREPSGGYRGINVVPANIRNFEAIPGMTAVSGA